MKLALIVILLSGSFPEETSSLRLPAAEKARPLVTTSFETLDALRSRSSARPRPVRSELWSRPSNAAELFPEISGARFVMDRGQALIDFLAGLPEQRRAYGIEALTVEEALIDGVRVCEDAMVDFEIDEGGETYEARYKIDPIGWNTEPTPALYALSSTCSEALRLSAGTVENAIGAGCSVEDEAAHFPFGTACRVCLQDDGDLERCIGGGFCRREMAREMFATFGPFASFYDVVESEVVVCAPNFVGRAFGLVQELGEDNLMPEPFVHQTVAWCNWFWDPVIQQPEAFCFGAEPGMLLSFADISLGNIEYVRRPGQTTKPYKDRLYMSSGVELEGRTYKVFPLIPGHFAQLSVNDRDIGGWAMNPREPRADNSGDSLARDWVASVGMKASTRITGVMIAVYNRNLCTEDRWKGPDSQGRYFCIPEYFDPMNPPPQDRLWWYDYGSFYGGPLLDRLDIFPNITLGSTGLPDPSIPGGHAIHILGTRTLADPDWENCAYPDIFVPDEIRTGDGFGPDETYTAQTYRFGKDAPFDIRVTLAANWRRAFCPLGPDGE